MRSSRIALKEVGDKHILKSIYIMKKYFLIAIAAFFALPLLNSCGPSGDPKKDAESFKGLADDAAKIEIEILEKKLEMAEYYAEEGKAKDYQKFLKKLNKLEEEVQKDYKKDIKAEDKRRQKAEKKMKKDDD